MNDLTKEDIDALEYVRACFPNRWKRVILEAWRTGDYSDIPGRSDNLDSTLQFLRNTRGPSWLFNLKMPKRARV